MPENVENVENVNVETPTIETPAADAVPAADATPEVKAEKTTKGKSKGKSTKGAATPAENSDAPTVCGMRITVVGRAVSLNGLENYETTVDIPRRENWQQYLRSFVDRKLQAESASIQGVQTTYIDDEEEIAVPVSFFGKDVMKLSREEIFPVAAYYGLRGLKKMQEKRAACISIYRQLCEYLGLEKPSDESTAKNWEPLLLKPLVCPKGDTVMPVGKPIAFIDQGKVWEKTFMKRD